MLDGVSPRAGRVLVGAGAVLFLGAGGLTLLAANQPWAELGRDSGAGPPAWVGQEPFLGEESPGPWDVAVTVGPLIAAGSVLLAGLARSRRRSTERSAPPVPAGAGDRSEARR